MKSLSRLLLLNVISLFCNNGIASHIKAVSPLDEFAAATYSDPIHRHLTDIPSSPGERPERTGEQLFRSNKSKTGNMSSANVEAENSFNQELQWRILNLLARQLFADADREAVAPLMLSQRVYTTQTFSVDFSPAHTGLLEIQIIDSFLGRKTQLQIPRL